MAATKPKNDSHVWRTLRRAGVVIVERSPVLETREQREARNAAIVDALEGASASVVAERYGLSRSAVLGLAYRHRQSRGLQPTAVTSLAEVRAERHQAVLVALQTGTVDEVADRFGLSARSVRDVRLTARRAAEALPETPRPTPSAERVTLRTTRAAPVPALPTIVPTPVTPTPVAVFACVPVERVTRVSLLDAQVDHCRSLGDDGLCCSAPVVPSRSWCPSHLALYTRPDRRRAR